MISSNVQHLFTFLSPAILVAVNQFAPSIAFTANNHMFQSRYCGFRPSPSRSERGRVPLSISEATISSPPVLFDVSEASKEYEKNDSSNKSKSNLLGTDDEWEAYEASMDKVLSAAKTFQRKDKDEDKDAIRGYLLKRDRVVPIQLPTLTDKSSNDVPDAGKALQLELEEQKAAFCEACGLTSSQYKLALRVLGYVGNFAAKSQVGLPLRVAWEKIKEMGCAPRENVLSTYLYGIALAEGGEDIDGGQAREGDGGRELIDLPGEVATFHDTLFQPTEKTLTLRIKALVRKGDAKGAECLFEMTPNAENGGDFKLRTYLPVLELYCEQGDISSALGLYKRMRRAPGVHFTAENYSLLLSAIAEKGYFRDDSDAIEGAEDIGYHPAKGSQLLGTLVSEMAEDVLEISSSCASRLRTAFYKEFGADLSTEMLSEEMSTTIDEPALSQAIVADRVSVDGETAECRTTKATLRLIALDKDQRAQLHDTLVEMANSQYEEYNEKLKQRKQNVEKEDAGYAAAQIRKFAEWIDGREGEPFTAIVDGANVAFFGRGLVDYNHVKRVVEGLERMGEKTLVVMPQKYLQPKFYVRRGTIQELSESDVAIMKELIESGKVYEVPKRCLDDYYWMLASVSDQTKSRNGVEIDVPPNQEGRWPGLRPMIVSNDQMRDHKLELLQPRLFRRWVSSFIIKYDFTPYVDDKWDERDVIFAPAEHFSREIQGNPTPDGGTAWHFPVSESEWNRDDWFCIRLPIKS